MPDEVIDIIHTKYCEENIQSIRKIITECGIENFQSYPWRCTENQFHALIAEILLQRTKARNALPVYESFTKKFQSVADLANSNLDELQKLIYPLGLLWRAKFLRYLGIELNKRNGEIPQDFKELIKLPGVGQYAASAWLSFHAGKKYGLIDANTVRFICRIVNQKYDGETRKKSWVFQTINKLTPENNFKMFNYALLDFCMLVCKRKPLCSKCPLPQEICEYRKRKLN